MIKEEDIKVGVRFKFYEFIESVDFGLIAHVIKENCFERKFVNEKNDAIEFVVTDYNRTKGEVSFRTVHPTLSFRIDNDLSQYSYGFKKPAVPVVFVLPVCKFCSLRIEIINNEDNMRYIDFKSEIPETVTNIIQNAEDVATMRHVLLELSSWFKYKHKRLPLIIKEPFNNQDCNNLLEFIVDMMKEEMKDEDVHRD